MKTLPNVRTLVNKQDIPHIARLQSVADSMVTKAQCKRTIKLDGNTFVLFVDGNIASLQSTRMRIVAQFNIA